MVSTIKKSLFLIIFVLFCFSLYTTNPTRDDFEVFVKENVRSELDSDSENVIDTFVASLTASLASKLTSSIVARDDYSLFSIYTLKLNNETLEYLGVFNTFVPLQ